MKYSDQGFTLLEVLIATFLFSVGLLTIAAVQISSLRTNTTAKLYTEASLAAAQQLETHIGMLFEDITSDTFAIGKYTINRNVTQTDIDSDGVADNNMRLITVNVTWNDRGIQRNRTLSVLRARDF